MWQTGRSPKIIVQRDLHNGDLHPHPSDQSPPVRQETRLHTNNVTESYIPLCNAKFRTPIVTLLREIGKTLTKIPVTREIIPPPVWRVTVTYTKKNMPVWHVTMTPPPLTLPTRNFKISFFPWKKAKISPITSYIEEEQPNRQLYDIGHN